MDNVTVKFQMPEKEIITYNGTEIEIVPFLSPGQQVYLVKGYLEQYFNNSEDSLVVHSECNLFEAEYDLLFGILQLLTNVDCTQLAFDNNLFADPAFYKPIYSKIINFGDFRHMLNSIILEVKEQAILKNSLGNVLSDLVEKAYETLNKFSDMSPEALEEMKQQGLELIERLEKSSVLGE